MSSDPGAADTYSLGSIKLSVVSLTITDTNDKIPSVINLRIKQSTGLDPTDFRCQLNFVDDEYVTTDSCDMKVPLQSSHIDFLLNIPINIFLFLKDYKNEMPDTQATSSSVLVNIQSVLHDKYQVSVEFPSYQTAKIILTLLLQPDELFLSFTQSCNLLKIENFKLTPLHNDIIGKYKLKKPKDPLPNDPFLLGVIDKVQKDNEKLKYTLKLSYQDINTFDKIIEFNNGYISVDQDEYLFHLTFPKTGMIFLTQSQSDIMKGIIESSQSFNLTFQKYEFKDKTKVWEVVTNQGLNLNGISMETLNIPLSQQWEYQTDLSTVDQALYQQCTLSFTITSDKPFVLPPIKPERPFGLIDDYVERVNFIPIELRPTSPLGELHKEIKIIIHQIATKFVELKNNDDQNIYQQLIYQLNKEGVYFNFKEELKRAIVYLIQEKYKQNDLEDKQFHSHLYSYLSEQMAVIINKEIFESDLHRIIPTVYDKETDLSTKLLSLKRLSDEYYLIRQYDKSESLLLERIKLSEESGNNDKLIWVDYAKFLLKQGKYEKALLPLRTALGMEYDTTILLTYIGVLFLCECNDECEVHLWELREKDYDNHFYWLLLRNLYEKFKTETHFNHTNFYTKSFYPNNYQAYLDLAQFYLDINIIELAKYYFEKCNEEFKPGFDLKQNCNHYILACRIYFIAHDYLAVVKYSNLFFSIDPANCKIYELYSLSCMYLSSDNKSDCHYDVLQLFQNTLSYLEKANTLPSPRFAYQAGLYFASNDDFLNAKNFFLRGCKNVDYSIIWLEVGKMCLELKEISEAEIALNKANKLNPNYNIIWGYLCKFYIEVDPPNFVEAEQCLSHALDLNLSDISLLYALAEAYYKLDKSLISNRLIKILLKLSDDDRIYILAVKVSIQQNKRNEVKQLCESYLQLPKSTQNKQSRQYISKIYAEYLRKDGLMNEALMIEETESMND